MDSRKIGTLIYDLRKEKNMTQKELAEELNISDKTVSKWECGQGCPDVSLLSEIAKIFKVDIEKILSGDLGEKGEVSTNMKKMNVYVCETCGNVIISTGEGDISCCGRKLQKQRPKKADSMHGAVIEEVEDDKFITFNHEMSKDHYIAFVLWVNYDRATLIKLYPEQAPEVRFPDRGKGKVYFFCSKHGFMELQSAK